MTYREISRLKNLILGCPILPLTLKKLTPVSPLSKFFTGNQRTLRLPVWCLPNMGMDWYVVSHCNRSKVAEDISFCAALVWTAR